MEAQIEEAIKFRKKANFKILTRLSQIIDQYPYLRFHQILMIYKVSELGVDKFNEESVETLKKLEHEMAEFKAKYDKYTSELGELRSRFNSWKTSEMERISKLKIALPKNLLDIFEEIRRQGDSSSK